MRFPILALLAEKPAHGYELKQAFDERFGAVWPPINAGQVYNTLAALERDELVRGTAAPQKGAPSRRVYELTDNGRAAFEDWASEPPGPPTLKEEFVVKLVLAHIAGTVDPMVLIDRQRQEYFKTVRQLDELATQQDDDPPARMLIGAAALYVEALLKWTDLCEEVFSARPSEEEAAT